ncbi:MFS transporter [Sporolactobacillus sp. CPB3-1]|uniref:MFS transporter n=1 Tax=Sporolactobacillus mangiferae TaxID=2940498 RepID=A0ABT0MBI6_9BACL|nr:MFS transporter [Sporolactobacillus mangiferae]MCL1631705.1 MFS transporter [Sporolactobacillus mangiferae]
MKIAKIHYGWVVVLITFLTLLVSAGVRSMPGVLIVPFQNEFGWGRGSISSVISLGILLYGLVGPFSAIFLQRFGIRKMVVLSLAVLGASLAVTPMMRALWQFELLWGLVSGLATGMMANVLGVTVSGNWFVKRRGLVVGLLTASAATGQLLFLPLIAKITVDAGWRYAMITIVAVIAVLMVIVVIWMRDHPYDVGMAPYGSTKVIRPEQVKGNALLLPLIALRSALANRTFWLLMGTFFFCGFSTNGLIGTHFIPAGHDHGISEVATAGMLAMMGVFDLLGTTCSGWLSDRMDSRKLLFWYYGLRGLSLLFLPYALDASHPMLVVFSVFYGLDWIATVPPTVKLAAKEFGNAKAGMVFGWVAVAHQLGASVAAFGAGVLRDVLGSYTVPFLSAGVACLFAAIMSLCISKNSKVNYLQNQSV